MQIFLKSGKEKKEFTRGMKAEIVAERGKKSFIPGMNDQAEVEKLFPLERKYS